MKTVSVLALVLAMGLGEGAAVFASDDDQQARPLRPQSAQPVNPDRQPRQPNTESAQPEIQRAAPQQDRPSETATQPEALQAERPAEDSFWTGIGRMPKLVDEPGEDAFWTGIGRMPKSVGKPATNKFQDRPTRQHRGQRHQRGGPAGQSSSDGGASGASSVADPRYCPAPETVRIPVVMSTVDFDRMQDSAATHNYMPGSNPAGHSEMSRPEYENWSLMAAARDLDLTMREHLETGIDNGEVWCSYISDAAPGRAIYLNQTGQQCRPASNAWNIGTDGQPYCDDSRVQCVFTCDD